MKEKEKIPNKETIKAMEDCENGIDLTTVDTVEELFEELNKE